MKSRTKKIIVDTNYILTVLVFPAISIICIFLGRWDMGAYAIAYSTFMLVRK